MTDHKTIFPSIRMPCTIMWAAVHLCRWLWTLTISYDWQYSVKKCKWPWGLNTTSWTQSRNGDEGEWPPSCPSHSSEDLTSHRMECCQPKNNVKRDKNLTLMETKFWFSNQNHSYHTDLNYPDSLILHIIKLLLLALLVLLIGWFLGLT
jgi:hypothetical protein